MAAEWSFCCSGKWDRGDSRIWVNRDGNFCAIATGSESHEVFATLAEAKAYCEQRDEMTPARLADWLAEFPAEPKYRAKRDEVVRLLRAMK